MTNANTNNARSRTFRLGSALLSLSALALLAGCTATVRAPAPRAAVVVRPKPTKVVVARPVVKKKVVVVR